MDTLPLELQTYILRHLDLNDLAACCQVSRGLRKSALKVISTITSIHHRSSYTDEIDYESIHLGFLLRNNAPQYTVSLVTFSCGVMASFLQFVTKYCPRLSSFVALRLFSSLKEISALGPRLTFLMLAQIASGGPSFIDEKSMAVNFPNLIYCPFYSCIPSDSLCPHEVLYQYSLLPSSQFAHYQEKCNKHERRCRRKINVRSIDSLKFISVESPLAVHELRPSTLNSLQFLELNSPPPNSDTLPPLPNLLRGDFRCDGHLNNMITWLHNSPKLTGAFFTCTRYERCIPAINLLLSKCSDLLMLQLYCMRRLDDDIGDDHEHPLDLSQAKSLKRINWFNIFIPSEVILPSQCETVALFSVSNRFTAYGCEYNFDNSVVFFRKMRPFPRPVRMELTSPDEERLNRVLHLCPQLSRVSIVDPFRNESHLVSIIERLIEKTDVSEIVIHNYGMKWFDELWLPTFFGVINKYPQRSFSIIFVGKPVTPLEPLIKPEVTRPFVSAPHHKDAKATHVTIPAIVDVSQQASSG